VAKKVKKTVKKAPAKQAVSKQKAAPKAKAAGKKVVGKQVAVRKASPKKKKVAQKLARPKKASKTSAPAGKNEKLTPEEIEGYRRLLLEKWTELIGDVNYMENEALRKSRLDAAGDLSSMPIHMADLGTDNFEQEFSLGLMDSERKILLEIVAALRRMNDGTFGICEGTGNPISKARLNANPWARYCIDYARMVEKGVISEGEKVYRKDDTAFDDESDEIDEDFEDEDNFDDAEEEDVEFEADADDDEDEEIEL